MTGGWTLDDMMAVRRLPEVAINPDGAQVAYVVAAADLAADRWRHSLFVERVGAPLRAEPVAVTEGRLRELAWSADGRFLAFLHDRGGATGLQLLDVKDGSIGDLHADLGEVIEIAWSPVGQTLALVRRVAQTDREHRQSREAPEGPRRHLFLLAVDEDGGKLAQLTSGTFSIAALFGKPSFSWSPDGARIAFSHRPTAAMAHWPLSDVSVVDVATRQVRPIAASGAAEYSPAFSPDGRWLAFTVSEAPPSWAFAWRVHVAAVGEQWRVHPLAPTNDERPVIVGWSGKEVVVAEAFGTIRGLAALPLGGGPARRLDDGQIDIGTPSLALSGGTVAFVGEDSSAAPEIFTATLAPFESRQLSRCQPRPPDLLGQTRAVTWRSADGELVEGLLSLPPTSLGNGPFPLLVVLHGGPAAVFTRQFVGSPPESYPYPIPVLASRGYAVLRPNVRGSSGYGKPFRHATREDWGGVDLADVMAGVDALVERGVADPERLAVAGWSYGGYLAAWAITRSDRFAAASVGGGFVDLVSYELTSDVPGFVTYYLGGTPWERPGLWRDRSPLAFAPEVVTPTLFQHNEGDPRVPASQAAMFLRALQMRGVPTRLSLFAEPGHTVQGPANLMRAMAENLEWFERWVSPARDSAPALHP